MKTNLKLVVLVFLVAFLVSTFSVEGAYSATTCPRNSVIHEIKDDETCWDLSGKNVANLRLL
ncbi:hypothetical protein LINPERPRIM_LOCUS4262, partial [Linum perenne]